MKMYNKPIMNIEEIELEDIILASGDVAGEDWTSDRVGTEPNTGWLN